MIPWPASGYLGRQTHARLAPCAILRCTGNVRCFEHVKVAIPHPLWDLDSVDNKFNVCGSNIAKNASINLDWDRLE